jgi:mannose-1-phosphate guanylyltransferase/phosphomannomutase
VGRVTRFQEKPAPEEVFSNLANGGVLIIDRPLIDEIPAGAFYDFSFDLFPKLLAAGVPLYGYEPDPTPYLIDIGSHESYDRAQREWPTPAAARWVAE